MNSKPHIAAVGSGIAGMASAWLLSRQYRVTLFEANDYLGGHTHTVDVTIDGKSHPVDTGFLVFNERTYPNLCALFDLFGVESLESEMSFSVSMDEPDLEWAGSNLATIFGQKRNLIRRQFWAMLNDTLRFNKESKRWVEENPQSNTTLREFLFRGHYSSSFSEWYLLPMAAAIWSSPMGEILNMPMHTFVRFCDNHGLLQIFNRPTWRTVKNGGRTYVEKMASHIADIRLGCPVQALRHEANGQVRLDHAEGSDVFDQVVLACHTDQALSILKQGGSPEHADQRDLLQAVRYQPNHVVLHTDATVMPRDHRLWAAWNYTSGEGSVMERPVGVTYWINRLQHLPFQTPVLVTLNSAREINPSKVLAEFEYDHPIFDQAAIEAQKNLGQVQGKGNVWLAGAWTRYGFHEDGLRSAMNVAHGLGVQVPWETGWVSHPSSAANQPIKRPSGSWAPVKA